MAEIEKSLEVKEHILVAFLDIKGTFNNIQPKTILSALKDFGISELLEKLFEQMLMGRSSISTLEAKCKMYFTATKPIFGISFFTGASTGDGDYKNSSSLK